MKNLEKVDGGLWLRISNVRGYKYLQQMTGKGANKKMFAHLGPLIKRNSRGKEIPEDILDDYQKQTS